MSQDLGPASRRVLQVLNDAATPSAEDRARGWATLQARIPVDLGPVNVPAPGPTLLSTKAGLFGKWLALGALALGGVGVGVKLWPHHASGPLAPPPRAALSLPPSPAVSTAASEAVLPAALPGPSMTRAPARSFAAPASSLAQEAELLHRARTALQGGDVALAEQRLLEHERKYPRSQLQGARSLLRVKVLCAQGEVGAARHEAASLRSRAPSTSEATALSRTCAGE